MTRQGQQKILGASLPTSLLGGSEIKGAPSLLGAGEMKMLPTSYDYPAGGQYNETVGVMADGRKLWINTQYADVLTKHTDQCAKSAHFAGDCMAITKAQHDAPCTCGALDGIDATAIVADARKRGLMGRPPRPEYVPEPEDLEPVKHGAGWCPKCESYCYGDCEASNG